MSSRKDSNEILPLWKTEGSSFVVRRSSFSNGCLEILSRVMNSVVCTRSTSRVFSVFRWFIANTFRRHSHGSVHNSASAFARILVIFSRIILRFITVIVERRNTPVRFELVHLIDANRFHRRTSFVRRILRWLTVDLPPSFPPTHPSLVPRPNEITSTTGLKSRQNYR